MNHLFLICFLVSWGSCFQRPMDVIMDSRSNIASEELNVNGINTSGANVINETFLENSSKFDHNNTDQPLSSSFYLTFQLQNATNNKIKITKIFERAANFQEEKSAAGESEPVPAESGTAEEAPMALKKKVEDFKIVAKDGWTHVGNKEREARRHGRKSSDQSRYFSKADKKFNQYFDKMRNYFEEPFRDPWFKGGSKSRGGMRVSSWREKPRMDDLDDDYNYYDYPDDYMDDEYYDSDGYRDEDDDYYDYVTVWDDWNDKEIKKMIEGERSNYKNQENYNIIKTVNDSEGNPVHIIISHRTGYELLPLTPKPAKKDGDDIDGTKPDDSSKKVTGRYRRRKGRGRRWKREIENFSLEKINNFKEQGNHFQKILLGMASEYGKHQMTNYMNNPRADTAAVSDPNYWRNYPRYFNLNNTYMLDNLMDEENKTFEMLTDLSPFERSEAFGQYRQLTNMVKNFNKIHREKRSHYRSSSTSDFFEDFIGGLRVAPRFKRDQMKNASTIKANKDVAQNSSSVKRVKRSKEEDEVKTPAFDHLCFYKTQVELSLFDEKFLKYYDEVKEWKQNKDKKAKNQTKAKEEEENNSTMTTNMSQRVKRHFQCNRWMRSRRDINEDVRNLKLRSLESVQQDLNYIKKLVRRSLAATDTKNSRKLFKRGSVNDALSSFKAFFEDVFGNNNDKKIRGS
ncbi:hypothetical protein HELRODRAFT_177315 [Helobdella robusta]|uniref:Uncharacterized protein n=1 Tax=Helobdella robusta TaxID=6412 RepID=T1FBH8_HELRO|nr:hypothetical protein HELRODRAFT_177315 [Helobdella robusta]ESN98080.1 hypothetical protein HELRODRAFT_177315 [Helobdella robusta]